MLVVKEKQTQPCVERHETNRPNLKGVYCNATNKHCNDFKIRHTKKLSHGSLHDKYVIKEILRLISTIWLVPMNFLQKISAEERWRILSTKEVRCVAALLVLHANHSNFAQADARKHMPGQAARPMDTSPPQRASVSEPCW